VPPQLSEIVPQVTPRAAQVVGVQQTPSPRQRLGAGQQVPLPAESTQTGTPVAQQPAALV
jgi:hypothetical protein